MFVSKDELRKLSDAIVPLDTVGVRVSYREGRFYNADKVKDLNMRYRWDLLHALPYDEFIGPIYARGGNDDHIDTALRKVVRPL